MAKCPGCGAQLRFDIKEQKLLCDYCGAKLDPYDYDRKYTNKDAKKVNDEMAGYMENQAGKKQEETDTFTVTVYTCPNCGGEIISTSNSATEVCTYCGAQVMLEQKEGSSIRPELIVPFSKDRDELRKICARKMKKAIFAPKALRDPSSISSFRGIYMPFWLYKAARNDKLSAKGTRQYSKGDYDYTDYYDISATADAVYDGIAFDSASSFEDAISAAIAPYPAVDTKPFTPSFISGFYADVSDVPESVYQEKAIEAAEDDLYDALANEPQIDPMSLEKSGEFFTGQDIQAKSALLPVWFMAYRKKDRVAYAVINGDTGKMALDMPVDPARYLLFSLITAVPIFLLIYFFYQTLAQDAVTVTGILAMIAVLVNTWEMRKIARKDSRADDLGFKAAAGMAEEQAKAGEKTGTEDKVKTSAETETKAGVKIEAQAMAEDKADAKGKVKAAKQAKAGKDSGKIGAGKVIFYVILIAIGGFLWVVSAAVLLVYCDIITIAVTFKWLKQGGKKCSPLSFLTLLLPFVSAAVLFYNPIYDSIFYATAMAQTAVLFLLTVETIRRYNVLSTRKLPQFRREGGDNRA